MAAETMVERVARAIFASQYAKTTGTWEGAGEAQRIGYIADARAAIEAMREPTEAILNAGAKSCADERGNPDEVSARSAWGVMLAAALK